MLQNVRNSAVLQAKFLYPWGLQCSWETDAFCTDI